MDLAHEITSETPRANLEMLQALPPEGRAAPQGREGRGLEAPLARAKGLVVLERVAGLRAPTHGCPRSELSRVEKLCNTRERQVPSADFDAAHVSTGAKC